MHKSAAQLWALQTLAGRFLPEGGARASRATRRVTQTSRRACLVSNFPSLHHIQCHGQLLPQLRLSGSSARRRMHDAMHKMREQQRLQQRAAFMEAQRRQAELNALVGQRTAKRDLRSGNGEGEQ